LNCGILPFSLLKRLNPEIQIVGDSIALSGFLKKNKKKF